MAEEVRIDLKSTADTSGADKMGAAIGGLEGKSKQAAQGVGAVSQGSKEMARGLGEGAAAGNAAVSAMAQLSTASKGGSERIMAIARAGFAAGVSLKSVMASMGPFGVAAAAIGVVMGAVSLAFRKAEADAEDSKEKMKEMNAANMEAVVTQLKNITDEAGRGKKAVSDEAAELDKMADAKLARDKAKVEADGALSPEEKQKQITKLQRQREDERINQTESTLAKTAQNEAGAASDIRIKAEDLAVKLALAQSAKPEAERLKAVAGELLKGLGGAFDGKGNIIAGFEGQVQQYRDADERARAAESRVPAAEALLADDNGIAKQARVAKEEAAKAQAEADKAKAALDAFRRQQAELNPITAEKRGYEDKKDAAKTPLTPQQQAAQDLSDLKAKEMFPSDYRGRIAAGIPVDREQLKRIYPGEVFGEAAPRPHGAPSGGTIQTSDGAKIQVNAKPLEKGLKESNDKARAAIDAELAKVATSVAAQSVALAATAAATGTLAAAQAAMQATVAQMQSQISSMRQSR